MCVEIAAKFFEAFNAHIRNIYITDAAVRELVHALDVVHYPFVVHERIFVGDRLDHYLATTFGSGVVDGDFGENVCRAGKQSVDVGHRSCRYAVDSGDIVALLDVEALSLERRTEFVAVRSAFVDFVDAVKTVFERKLSAKHTGI